MITSEYFAVRRAYVLDRFSDCTIIGTTDDNKKHENSVPIPEDTSLPQNIESIITLKEGKHTGIAGLRVTPHNPQFTDYAFTDYWKNHTAYTGVIFDGSSNEIPWWEQDAHRELYKHITDPDARTDNTLTALSQRSALEETWKKTTRLKFLQDCMARCVFTPKVA